MTAMTIRWLIWILAVAAWTAALLLPVPFETGPEGPFGTSFNFSANSLHFLAYTLLTVLAGWLRVRWPERWLLIAFLSAHGCATEYLQGFTSTRYPSWLDLGLDHVGIAIGLAISWKKWRNDVSS